MTIDYTAALILCFFGGAGVSFVLLTGVIRAALHVERRRLLKIEDKWEQHETAMRFRSAKG